MSRQVDQSVKLPGFASFLSLADACVLKGQILSRSRSDDYSFDSSKQQFHSKPPPVDSSTPRDLFGAPNDANRKRRRPWESDWDSRSDTNSASNACPDADVTPGCNGADLVTPAAMTSRLNDDVTPLSQNSENCSREIGLLVPERTGDDLPMRTSARSPLSLPRPDRAVGDLTSPRTAERYVAPAMTAHRPSLPLPDFSCGRPSPLLLSTTPPDDSRTTKAPPPCFADVAASPRASMRPHVLSSSSLLDLHKPRQSCDQHQQSAGRCCGGSPSGAVDSFSGAEGRRNSISALPPLLYFAAPCAENGRRNSPLLPSVPQRFHQAGQARLHSPANKTPLASVEASTSKHVSSPRHSAMYSRLQRRLDQCRLHVGDGVASTFAPIAVPTTSTGSDVTTPHCMCPAIATGRDVASPHCMCAALNTARDVAGLPTHNSPSCTKRDDVDVSNGISVSGGQGCHNGRCSSLGTLSRCGKGQVECPSLQPGPSSRCSQSIFSTGTAVRDTDHRPTTTCSSSHPSLGPCTGSNWGPNPSRSSPIFVPSVCLDAITCRDSQPTVPRCSPASSLPRTQVLSTGAAASPTAYCHSHKDRENNRLHPDTSPVSRKDCPNDMGRPEHDQKHQAGPNHSKTVGPPDVTSRAIHRVTSSQELGRSPRGSVARSVAPLHPNENRHQQPAHPDRGTYSPFQAGAAEVPCAESSPMRRGEAWSEPSSADKPSHAVSFDPTGEFSMTLMAGFAYGMAYAKSFAHMADPTNQLVPSVGGQAPPAHNGAPALNPLGSVQPAFPPSLPDLLPPDYRRSRVMRYIREVRPKISQSEKTIRYVSRSTIARTRSRVGGRFAKEAQPSMGSQVSEHRPL